MPDCDRNEARFIDDTKLRRWEGLSEEERNPPPKAPLLPERRKPLPGPLEPWVVKKPDPAKVFGGGLAGPDGGLRAETFGDLKARKDPVLGMASFGGCTPAG